MDDSTLARIRATDWLAHRWPFEVRKAQLMYQGDTHYVNVGPCPVASLDSAAAAHQWIEQWRPRSLAEVIASHPQCLPTTAYVEFAGGRVRIPERFWPSYDAIDLSHGGERVTVLSAKARALFPGFAGVFIRTLRRGGR